LNSLELAKSNIRQALERLRHAKEAFEEGNYPFTVRQSQEAVELALKASLRLVGIEPPKWHDVGPVLKREREKFPQWFQESIDELASTSRSLRKERELAMYGDEEAGVSPEELYVRSDAEYAIRSAEKVVLHVNRLLDEVVGKSQ